MKGECHRIGPVIYPNFRPEVQIHQPSQSSLVRAHLAHVGSGKQQANVVRTSLLQPGMPSLGQRLNGKVCLASQLASSMGDNCVFRILAGKARSAVQATTEEGEF